MTLHHIKRPTARRMALGVATLAASGLLAACGSSGATGPTGSSAAKTTTSESRSAFVACLEKHGATPPPGLTNGTRPRSHSGPPPAGLASNPTRLAAFKACGASGHPRRP
jgi:hypothetical protein